MSTFNLDEFKNLFNGPDKKEQITSLARTAEATERYDDMCQVIQWLVQTCNETTPPTELSVEERNLLSVAYKNVIGTRRASWRTLKAESDENKDSAQVKALVDKYKSHVETEIKQTCDEVIDLLDKLIPGTNDCEPKVFYLKMAGDYYRYLAESSSTDAAGVGEKAASYYEKANTAAKDLSETHPIRLGLALNYSVCYYEILKEPNKACELAKGAFDDAIAKLDKLEESDYKDSTLIMQLLRDNLTLWTADSHGESNEVQVQDLSDEEN